MEGFIEKVAALLEEESVSRDALLSSFEYWDSMTALSVIAMVHTDYKVTIGSTDLRGLKTVGDLEDLVTTRMKA